MKDIKIVKILEYGESLGPRVLGAQICDQILNSLQSYSLFVIDFSGVRSISSGFAFELISKLRSELKDDFKKRITIKISNSLDPDMIKAVISRALSTPYRPTASERMNSHD